MSGSVFDPSLWAEIVSAVVDMLGDPVVQGVLVGLLFVTTKRIWTEGLHG